MEHDRDRDFEQFTFQGKAYRRYKKDRESPRGTIEILDQEGAGERSIPGFPSIRRVYRLKQGIRRLFGNSPFHAEEKLDGYNVRIFLHDGRLPAASRGGFLCPFTTEWAEIWGEDCNLHRFFRDYPDHVLCGEVVGDNPYNRQRDPELSAGAHFFVFEIAAPDGQFLRPADRYRLVEEYDLPAVPNLGEFHVRRIDALYELLRDLNERGREGVVLKDRRGKRRLKFVTPTSDLQDIRDALAIGFDMASGYFFNRYMRAVIFVRELGLDEAEYARHIGQAFLDGVPGSHEFSEASEQYRIYVRERRTWEALYERLQSHVLLKEDNVVPGSAFGRDMLRVDFRRVFQRSSHRYRLMLGGYLHAD